MALQHSLLMSAGADPPPLEEQTPIGEIEEAVEEEEEEEEGDEEEEDDEDEEEEEEEEEGSRPCPQLDWQSQA